ncbi:Tat binding protein 1-interacting protein-domain-containing protein [Aspergillus egyptiacus]|nr:Tat binding protein 1-interacting protein-domain-containing protein [Aspergillus egyptiacus]
MVQKKGKAEKPAAGDASVDGSAMILDYLIKALRDLHQKKEIECRISGKQTVYHAVQEEAKESSPDAAAAMDEEIVSLQEKLASLKEDEKKLQTELASLNAIPLLAELRCEMEKLDAERNSLSARLAKVHGGGEEHVSLKEKEHARKHWRFWQNEASVRAKICRDLWRKCSETMPENMNREEFWEHLGLEGTPM